MGRAKWDGAPQRGSLHHRYHELGSDSRPRLHQRKETLRSLRLGGSRTETRTVEESRGSEMRVVDRVVDAPHRMEVVERWSFAKFDEAGLTVV